ncbi:MAG: tetratricopeptide repeat protein [Bacteroidota bacterium]
MIPPMASTSYYNITAVKKYTLLLLFFLFFSVISFSQKAKADSLGKLLATETRDSSRVNLLLLLARATNVYNPDTALTFAYHALSLSKNIHYVDGESRSLGSLASTFRKIGNYSRALEFSIQKLQLEEKTNKPQNLAGVLISIGTVYREQEDYRMALDYYSTADSIIRKHNIEELKYYNALNIGDAYNLLDISDSAFSYFDQSLQLARVFPDKDQVEDFIGTSLTGLGHSYLKLGNYDSSLSSYQTAIGFLRSANDDEILCEATLGLANLYKHLGRHDSALYYGKLSLSIAKKDGFLSMELDAAEFLTDHYKQARNIENAFTYVSYVKSLNDSVNSKSKIRESQVISSNEHFRQLEREEERKLAGKQRFEQLQMLLIAIFIPGFFLITLLLSRVNVHVKLIRLLGILSLLFLFEYLTLLLHPTVARLTHHTPVYEILIFVAMGAILIPLHHRLEHWLIHKLIHHRHGTKLVIPETVE